MRKRTADGGPERLVALADGVFAIAITLLILDVRVEQSPGESLATALHHALPEIGAYVASFLQIGIMWANHHALFRLIDRVDQLLLLFNLLLLGFVSFLPLPTRLVAEHTSGADARTAVLLYGGTLDEAVESMRGVPGTKIGLTVVRPGRDKPFDVALVRERIELKPVKWEVRDRVGVININTFNAQTAAATQAAMVAVDAGEGDDQRPHERIAEPQPGRSNDERRSHRDARDRDVATVIVGFGRVTRTHASRRVRARQDRTQRVQHQPQTAGERQHHHRAPDDDRIDAVTIGEATGDTRQHAHPARWRSNDPGLVVTFVDLVELMTGVADIPQPPLPVLLETAAQEPPQCRRR